MSTPLLTHYQVLERIIGPTIPRGCSQQDIERLESTRLLASVAEDAVQHLLFLSRSKDSHEDSVARIGKRAAKAIEGIAEMVRNDDEGKVSP